MSSEKFKIFQDDLSFFLSNTENIKLKPYCLAEDNFNSNQVAPCTTEKNKCTQNFISNFTAPSCLLFWSWKCSYNEVWEHARTPWMEILATGPILGILELKHQCCPPGKVCGFQPSMGWSKWEIKTKVPHPQTPIPQTLSHPALTLTEFQCCVLCHHRRAVILPVRGINTNHNSSHHAHSMHSRFNSVFLSSKTLIWKIGWCASASCTEISSCQTHLSPEHYYKQIIYLTFHNRDIQWTAWAGKQQRGKTRYI